MIVLTAKEFLNADIDWFSFYNHLAGYVAVGCCVLFVGAFVYLWKRYKREQAVPVKEIASVSAPEVSVSVL